MWRLWIPLRSVIPKKNVRFMCEKKLEKPDLGSRGKSRMEDPMKGKGPVTWYNLGISAAALAAVIGTYGYVKKLKNQEMDNERKREIGKAKIGGPFNLVDHEGKPKSDKDFLGKWMLLYFGFTHCPDVCPDEMEKMAEIYEVIKASKEPFVGDIVPIFITVDPDRDSVKAVSEYVKEFHPEIIGLTGTEEQVKEACKSYRVYFSAGPRDEDNDYIVDHTIIIYVVDPEGNFLDYYGQKKTAAEVASSIKLHMLKLWNKTNQGFFSGLIKS